MPKRDNMVAIDGKKLKNELQIRGLNHSEAGRKIHCSESFISTTLRKEKCARDKLLLIETVLKISYDSIKRDPEPEPKPQAQGAEENGAEQISIQELLQLCREIKETAGGKTDGPGLEAVIHAIDENMLPIREAVEAVTQRKHKIATISDLTEGHIANGVKNGMDAWWKTHSSDVQGAVFAGVYNALVKFQEFRTTQAMTIAQG